MMIAAAKLASRVGQFDNRRPEAWTRHPHTAAILPRLGYPFDLSQCLEAGPVVNYIFIGDQTNDH
jgi:hypothetical protein